MPRMVASSYADPSMIRPEEKRLNTTRFSLGLSPPPFERQIAALTPEVSRATDRLADAADRLLVVLLDF